MANTLTPNEVLGVAPRCGAPIEGNCCDHAKGHVGMHRSAVRIPCGARLEKLYVFHWVNLADGHVRTWHEEVCG